MAALPRILTAVATTVALAGSAAPALAAPDPLISQQWALSDPQAVGAQVAWSQSTGSGVVVALLDSGVQLNHPDLAGNIWTNPNEVVNGKDDDNNGIIDDVHGANMFTGNGDVEDDEGHGTHTAGIIAAEAGDGVGGAGLAPNATIMPIKVLDSNRSGNSTVLARGIRYAVDEGARILSISINGDSTTSDLTAALKYATDKGATIVCSAGNNSRDIDLTPSWPASSTEPSVLTVTAEDEDLSLASFANTGLNSVDLAAPGDMILSTARGSGYENRSGTSMSAPFVSASLALLASARPDLSQAALRNALLSTAPKRSFLAGLLGGNGGGGLDVGAAMHAILPGDMWRTTPGGAVAARSAAAAVRVRTAASVRAGRRATVRWSATGAANVTTWRILLDGKRIADRSVAASRVLRRKIDKAGKHTWKVVGYDAADRRVVAGSRGFRVLRAR
jgi:subtilisin family serine protease